MFCNSISLQYLTAYLDRVTDNVVVCPGSRNAPIAHNLYVLSVKRAALGRTALRLHSVTDERSAAFVAIGIYLATRRPVAVCVTSGSALLNLLPGVAEASFRHIPLLIISADRPPQWIGQLDGQTLPQRGALEPYCHTIQLDEIFTNANGCYTMGENTACQTQLRETIMALYQEGGHCSHINVPLTEPLFDFTMPLTLPDTEALEEGWDEPPLYTEADVVSDKLRELLIRSSHPALVIGQWEKRSIEALTRLQELGWTIFAENISNQHIYNDSIPPEIDLLVHIGGTFVEKRLKLQLRAMDIPVIRIAEDHDLPATFGRLDLKIVCHAGTALRQIASMYDTMHLITDREAERNLACSLCTDPPELDLPIEALFVGNSSAVRWANRHLRVTVPTYCNRGVNGIEGSLSVAAGYSLATRGTVLCVLGDLSFFYDSNALWNKRLRGNLRILLLNDHRGGIFHRLPGLNRSPALKEYISASHDSDARGIALSYHCTYLKATSHDYTDDRDELLDMLLSTQSDRPVILEVFTR